MKITHIKYIPISEVYLENKGLLSFTSFVTSQHKYIFLPDHLERLLAGACYFFQTSFELDNKTSLIQQIKDELETNFLAHHHYRFIITKDNMFLSRMTHKPKPLELSASVVDAIKKKNNYPSFVKNGDYHESFRKLRLVQLNSFEEVIFLDNKNIISEASTSNIFIVTQGGRVITNRDSQDVLAGITRKKIIQYINQFENTVEVRDITLADLSEAREIWLTNAVQGMRFITNLDNNLRQRPGSLFDKILEGFGRFGENFNE